MKGRWRLAGSQPLILWGTIWIVDAHCNDGRLCICVRTKIHRSSETAVSEEPPGCQNVVLIFFLMRYHTVVATRREINLARQFCRVSLVHRTETNFARQPFEVIRLLPGFDSALAAEMGPR
jgi:hypothetical protein